MGNKLRETEAERVQAEINRLIDWYEVNKPDAGREILVNVEPKLLDFAIEVVKDHLYEYRGRRLRRAVT